MRLIGTIEGSEIVEDDDGRVMFIAGAAIDCDGSGGNPHHDPCFQPDTTLHHNGEALNAEEVPFIVVPPLIIQSVVGVVMGCQANVRYKHKTCPAVVGDIGPKAKIGEMSPACAEVLGINPNPNNGGVDESEVFYELWPGVPAVVNGVQYQLQPA